MIFREKRVKKFGWQAIAGLVEQDGGLVEFAAFQGKCGLGEGPTRVFGGGVGRSHKSGPLAGFQLCQPDLQAQDRVSGFLVQGKLEVLESVFWLTALTQYFAEIIGRTTACRVGSESGLQVALCFGEIFFLEGDQAEQGVTFGRLLAGNEAGSGEGGGPFRMPLAQFLDGAMIFQTSGVRVDGCRFLKQLPRGNQPTVILCFDCLGDLFLRARIRGRNGCRSMAEKGTSQTESENCPHKMQSTIKRCLASRKTRSRR